VLPGVRGPRATVADSKRFISPPTRAPEETEAAREAHEGLVERLLELGWEVDDHEPGSAWYELAFRLTMAPAEHPADRA
jgi:hypothetical protein